jgi:hypothetical protein
MEILHRHHATVASTFDTDECGLAWVVDYGASRHFSAISSEFLSLTLDDKLGTVRGINCKIEGFGCISFLVHGKQGRSVAPTPGEQQQATNQQLPTVKTMRRSAQLLRDLEAAKLRMEREPRGIAKNRRADAIRAAQAAASLEDINGLQDISPLTAFVVVSGPTSNKRAISGDEPHEWTRAKKQEIDSHTKMGTWELIPR